MLCNKRCKKCSEIKNTSEFCKRTASPDGLHPYCRKCTKEFNKIFSAPNLPDTKVCSKCHTQKSARDFCYDKYRPDGLTSNCKSCRKQAETTRSKNAVISEFKFCNECSGEFNMSRFYKTKSTTDGYSNICKNCFIIKQHVRIANRPPISLPVNKECSRCHNNLSANNFYKDRTAVDGLHGICKACENTIKTNVYNPRRRAKKKTVKVVAFTIVDWEMRKLEFNYRCAYCEKQSTKLTQDHFIPLSRNGDHSIQNIVPACNSCNSSKGGKHPFDFIFNLHLFDRVA